jgi:hypothetical protein
VVVTIGDPKSFTCSKCGAKPGVSCLSYRGKIQTLTRFHHARVDGARGFFIDPDGKARPTLAAGIHMECGICGAQPGHVCISMAKRYSGDYGCRGRAISLPSWTRDRKTFHKERVLAAVAESDRRKTAAAEYNTHQLRPERKDGGP